MPNSGLLRVKRRASCRSRVRELVKFLPLLSYVIHFLSDADSDLEFRKCDQAVFDGVFGVNNFHPFIVVC